MNIDCIDKQWVSQKQTHENNIDTETNDSTFVKKAMLQNTSVETRDTRDAQLSNSSGTEFNIQNL